MLTTYCEPRIRNAENYDKKVPVVSHDIRCQNSVTDVDDHVDVE
jgi:hypothetical protein